MAKRVTVKSASGSSCEPQAISRMLGVLKYQATKGKGTKQEEAESALTTYKGLPDTESRRLFLSAYEKEGSGKNGFKFAMKFAQTLETCNKSETAMTEDMLTRPVAMMHVVAVMLLLYTIAHEFHDAVMLLLYTPAQECLEQTVYCWVDDVVVALLPRNANVCSTHSDSLQATNPADSWNELV